MNHIHDEILIEAPVEHVWTYLCDASHMDEWEPRSKHTDFSGPLDQVGTTFVETSQMMGFKMRSTNTVVEVEPLRLRHIRSDMGPMRPDRVRGDVCPAP